MQASRLNISDRLQSPGGFSFLFASDFVCVGCLVCGYFALVFPRTCVLQSPVGFRDRTVRKVLGRTQTWGHPNRL